MIDLRTRMYVQYSTVLYILNTILSYFIRGRTIRLRLVPQTLTQIDPKLALILTELASIFLYDR